MNTNPTDNASIARVRASLLDEVGAAHAATRRSHTKRAAVVGAVLVGALGATGGTLAVIQANKADIDGSIRCFVATNTAADYTDVAEPPVDGSGAEPTITARAVDVCGAMWRAGRVTHGKLESPDDPNSGNNPVPSLTACRLRDGIIGVFPSIPDADTCLELGLVPAS